MPKTAAFAEKIWACCRGAAVLKATNGATTEPHEPLNHTPRNPARWLAGRLVVQLCQRCFWKARCPNARQTGTGTQLQKMSSPFLASPNSRHFLTVPDNCGGREQPELEPEGWRRGRARSNTVAFSGTDRKTAVRPTTDNNKFACQHFFVHCLLRKGRRYGLIY